MKRKLPPREVWITWLSDPDICVADVDKEEAAPKLLDGVECRAALRERARIVAWLRRVGTDGFSEELTCAESVSFIERGEHLE